MVATAIGMAGERRRGGAGGCHPAAAIVGSHRGPEGPIAWGPVGTGDAIGRVPPGGTTVGGSGTGGAAVGAAGAMAGGP